MDAQNVNFAHKFSFQFQLQILHFWKKIFELICRQRKI